VTGTPWRGTTGRTAASPLIGPRRRCSLGFTNGSSVRQGLVDRQCYPDRGCYADWPVTGCPSGSLSIGSPREDKAVVMSRDALRVSIAAICAIVCVACPIVIAWFGHTYGFDRLNSDAEFRSWRVYAVEALLWVALLATIGLIVSLRRWWWLGALVAVPLLVITAMLSVTCSMWLDGTYF
jgi:hypothetical protein